MTRASETTARRAGSRARALAARAALCVLAALAGVSGYGIAAAGPSYRIYPSAVTQTETFITRHPVDSSILFASANTINLATGFVSEGIYVSTNAGMSWSGSDTCNGAPITFHRGDPGIAIDKDGRFVLVRLGAFPPGVYAHFSTDNGATWSTQRTVATGDQDRASLASDGDAASAHYGRTYTVWVKFATPFPVFFAYSDNGGSSWSTPAQVNAPPQRCQGGEVAIGPGGSVNAVWSGVIAASPFTEDYAGFARSTDGGATWTVDENAFDMNGIAGTFPAKSNIRVNGLPRLDVDDTGGPRDGWIYVVTCEKDLAPAGSDPDIVFHRSTDNGASWSSGTRVNQDPLSNGKYQYFPAIQVDDAGGVNVLYYDDRTTTSDSASVFLSRSLDGGATWTEIEVSDHHFRPSPIGGLGQGYQGDNIALTSVGDMLWPLWMDNFSGIYQIWTCPIDISDPATGVGSGEIALSETSLRNFPNPFNPSTTVEFTLARRGAVRLDVIDVMGTRVAQPVNGVLGAGRHRVTIDAARWPSGVYVYRLQSDDAIAARKMTLLR